MSSCRLETREKEMARYAPLEQVPIRDFNGFVKLKTFSVITDCTLRT